MPIDFELGNAVRSCIENISHHSAGGWIEFRAQRVHPILRVKVLDDCVLHKDTASKIPVFFGEYKIPVLLCGQRACFYYSSETYGVFSGDVRDIICRILRSGVKMDGDFYPKALSLLIEHYGENHFDDFDFYSEESIPFAQFMGFTTALYPENEKELSKRYMLFRWASLYLLYRFASPYTNDPVILPSTEDPRAFVEEMWDRYYSRLEDVSDIKESIGSGDDPDMAFVSRWSSLPQFTQDIHWLTNFWREELKYDHVLSFAGVVAGRDRELEMDIGGFIRNDEIAVYSLPFGLLPAYIYRSMRMRGRKHQEILKDLKVITSSPAGKFFQATVLNLMGEGVPYRPNVYEISAPPMEKSEFLILMREGDQEGFDEVVMDWREREDVAELMKKVDFLWDSASHRITILLDATEKSMQAANRLFGNNHVKVILTHEGNGAVAFLLTSRGVPKRAYTKLVRFKEVLDGEEQSVEDIENAENRLDSGMARLNVPSKKLRFFYYRDGYKWLLASLQEKFVSDGGAALALVPGYIWWLLSHYKWTSLKDIAKIYVGQGPCIRDKGGDHVVVSARGVSKGRMGSEEPVYVDIAIIPWKDSFKVVQLRKEVVLCEGGIGLVFEDNERLVRWFLQGRVAFILYHLFGIKDLPIPLISKFEGNPDKFLLRRVGGLKDDIIQPPVQKVSLPEYMETLERVFSEKGLEEMRAIDQFLRDRVFDKGLRDKLFRIFWKKKYGNIPQTVKGERLF